MCEIISFATRKLKAYPFIKEALGAVLNIIWRFFSSSQCLMKKDTVSCVQDHSKATDEHAGKTKTLVATALFTPRGVLHAADTPWHVSVVMYVPVVFWLL